MSIQRIVPFLWYDTQAREAAQLYADAFPNSSVEQILTLKDTPSGTVEVFDVMLAGYQIKLMSAGPDFHFTPAVSFAVSCAEPGQVDELWQKLSVGGSVLMELGEHPFSSRYGWLQDRFGFSWQVMVSGVPADSYTIVPTLLFAGDRCGKAEEAINRYTRVFDNSAVGDLVRYEPGEEPERPGTLKFGSFRLEGQEFAAMDSARTHHFTFTEATSFEVDCQTQQEIDYLWERLSADPSAEQCGWLKDSYGVSWQIVPRVLENMLSDSDHDKVVRVTEAFLPMKKLVIADLERAYARG